MAEDKRAAKIAALNDRLRMRFDLSLGRIMLTAGVSELEPARKARVLQAVQTFASFDDDNDPYGEHDFGSFEQYGEKFFWKIDYYEKGSNFSHGAEAPESETTTDRVLTIMLASEY